MGTSHTSPGKPHYHGLDLEKTLDSGRGRTIFLTSLVIELTDCIISPEILSAASADRIKSTNRNLEEECPVCRA